MPRITPNLWFDAEGLEAAQFYVSVFPNSKITNVSHYGEAGPREAGTVLTVDFVLDGQEFTAINDGPEFTFDEAVSLLINCADQKEVDYCWDKLTEGRRGGPVRVAEGQVRPLLAGRSGGAGRADDRPRRGTRPARHEGHARDEEARRHRAPRGRRPGVAATAAWISNSGQCVPSPGQGTRCAVRCSAPLLEVRRSVCALWRAPDRHLGDGQCRGGLVVMGRFGAPRDRRFGAADSFRVRPVRPWIGAARCERDLLRRREDRRAEARRDVVQVLVVLDRHDEAAARVVRHHLLFMRTMTSSVRKTTRFGRWPAAMRQNGHS